jgi:hypothetical protein
MASDAKAVLSQIDVELEKAKQLIASSKYDDLSDLRKDARTFEVATTLHATIDSFAPRNSVYITNANECGKNIALGAYTVVKALEGILRSLRNSYEQGYLKTVQELIHADLFSDFLEMAEHLLDQGYKDAAAVIVGSTLEGHLHKLALKNGISVTQHSGSNKKADTLNAELSGGSVYTKLDLKSVTGWLELRNKAAHGKYSEFDKTQVALMLEGVRHFISRNPA